MGTGINWGLISHTCLTPGLRRLNSWAQVSVFVSCDTTTWSLYHSCFRLARLQKHRGGGKPGGNQMAICDLALEFTHALWFLLYSRLSNSIYWKQVTKDGPHQGEGELNFPLSEEACQRICKYFVKKITSSNYSSCVLFFLPNTAYLMKSHSLSLLLEGHEWRDLVFFTAALPVTQKLLDKEWAFTSTCWVDLFIE